jgi:putative ABC transport system permease protein
MKFERAETFLQDLRFALRVLRRSRGFTATTVILLALGIGSNTAIFSVISSAFLRPLPFPDADRLVFLWDDFSASGGASRVEASPTDYTAWKARSRTVADMAAMVSNTYSLTGSGEPEKVVGIRTTANLFSVLGTTAIIGRPLQPVDDAPGASAVLVMSERWWRARFGSDPRVVGRSVNLNGAPYTVVGVVPDDFPFPDPDAAVWVAAQFTSEELGQAFNYFMYVVARLKPGVALAQAQAEMTGIAVQLTAERRAPARIGATVSALREHVTRDVRRPTLLLALGSLLILVIACANVAGLLLAHGTNRSAELTVRNVLGAERSRLVRQLLTESLVLATAGAAVGILLATFTFDYLRRLMPPGLPSALTPTLDIRVLLFTSAVTVVVVLAAGTMPTWLTVRAGLEAVLRANSGRLTRQTWARSALVFGELALTVILLTAAGLLLRSYTNVLGVDAGFNAANLLLAETTLSPATYASPERRQAFYDRVLERVRAIPGVTNASYVNFAPLTFKGGRALISIEGRPAPPPSEMARFITSDRIVSTGYFSTLQVGLIRGRDFDSRDIASSQPVAIINQKMAQLHWPGEDPIGHRIAMGVPRPDARWATIVGIVDDMRQMSLDLPPEPEFYLPASQLGMAGRFLWPRNLVVRTKGDPLELTAAVRRAVWAVDSNQPVGNVRTMSDVLDTELLGRNTQMMLVGVFALLALVIAVVGLYGLLAYGVAQRRRDIGVRMALGAQRAQVVGQVARQSMLLVMLGLGGGFLVSWPLGGLLRTWLFGVSSTDPVTYGVTAIVLVVAALVASIVPAARAASVQPAAVLRAE